ncbi:ankyrin repeat-containing domain protein [Tirmania nivea]|nr:ankyrin repeat-containing domain protein [Tirmania nivea]
MTSDIRRDGEVVPLRVSVSQRPSITAFRPKFQSPPDIDLNEPSESPLHHAAQFGNHEKVQQLLQAQQRLARKTSMSRATGEGADLRLVDSHGFTALHYAVQGGFPKVVKCLLDFPGGRLTEVRDNVGKSAMHWGAQLGALKTMELLCKAKASVIAVDRFGWMPLHYLCVSEAARDTGHEDDIIAIINLMIEQKSPRGEAMRIWLLRDTQGRTPLHLAATNGVTNAVFRRLLELEPDYPFARISDKNGWNTLHWAVFGGQTEILRALIGNPNIAGSNLADTVNEQTTEGWSTLHLTAMAVRNEVAIKITEILVKECGAKTMLEDKKGRIPLYYAHLQAFNFPKVKGIKAIIPLLEGGGAGEAYRKRFSPGKTAFNEIARRHDAYLMRSKVLTFPRDPVAVPGCRPLPYQACLARLQKIIQQKQLEPIFSPPKVSTSDLSVVLFPYASSFSTLPLAVKALPTYPLMPPIPNELVLDLGALTLYDHSVVIDDSSSMGFALGGSRRESVLCVLRNISVVNQFLNSPRGRELKTLCFSSAPKRRLSPQQIGFDGCVNSHRFGGTSGVGMGVWEAVWKPTY